MRTAFSIVLALCLSCSGDDNPEPDKGPPHDEGAEDSVTEMVDGDPCSKVQQCMQQCDADRYAECAAACKATGSEKALALIDAYETCAKEAIDGECEDKCAGGSTDEACGDCALKACLTLWNDCYEDV